MKTKNQSQNTKREERTFLIKSPKHTSGGAANGVAFIGVKPDLTLSTLEDRGREALLSTEVSHFPSLVKRVF